MAKVTQWQCNVEPNGELTVGAPSTLTCQGEPNQLKRETLSLRRPKDNPYALRILKVDQLEESSVTILATTYVVGEQGTQVYGYGITDGENTVEFNQFALNTKSVITQENNPEGKPYPPFGPVQMSYPLYIWITIAAVLLVLGIIIARIIYIARQRKQFLRELSEKSTALGAYHQLQKDLRQITRTLPVSDPAQWQAANAEQAIAQLDQSYRWFLAREFKVPAHKWSGALVNREIKRSDRRLYKKIEKQLTLTDRELKRAQKNAARTSINDFQQLLEIVRKSADMIHLDRQENRR